MSQSATRTARPPLTSVEIAPGAYLIPDLLYRWWTVRVGERTIGTYPRLLDAAEAAQAFATPTPTGGMTDGTGREE